VYWTYLALPNSFSASAVCGSGFFIS